MKNFLEERNPGIIVLGYIFLILLLYLSCHFLFEVPLPTSENLYRWDTGWYLSILENGYEFNPNSQSNSAFFPLFPFFWKFLGVDAFWISIINGLIFLLSFYLLSRVFQFKNWQSLLFISAPSLFFCFVAYSEAFFFLTSTILLIGYKRPRRSLTAAGIFFSSMARSASMLFLPAILLSEVPMMKRLNWKSWLWNLLIFVGAALMGMAAVMFIQYLDTGKWFVLFEVMKQWDRNLKIPILPYWTWGPRIIYGWMAIAFSFVS